MLSIIRVPLLKGCLRATTDLWIVQPRYLACIAVLDALYDGRAPSVWRDDAVQGSPYPMDSFGIRCAWCARRSVAGTERGVDVDADTG